MKFKIWNVKLRYSKYHTDDSTAILLVSDDVMEEPIATATVNLSASDYTYNIYAKDNRFVAIKNYSENEGMVNFLLENKIIEYHSENPIMQAGMASVQGFNLTDEAYAEFKKQVSA